jgi:hypothetical protein
LISLGYKLSGGSELVGQMDGSKKSQETYFKYHSYNLELL